MRCLLQCLRNQKVEITWVQRRIGCKIKFHWPRCLVAIGVKSIKQGQLKVVDLCIRLKFEVGHEEKVVPVGMSSRGNIQGIMDKFGFLRMRCRVGLDFVATRWHDESKKFQIPFFFLIFTLQQIIVPLSQSFVHLHLTATDETFFLFHCVVLFHPTRVRIDDWKIGASRSTPTGHGVVKESKQAHRF